MDRLAELSATGVAIWLDDISRDRLRTGGLQDLIDSKHVVGVTSNPTIFQKALSQGDAYDAQLADLATRGVDLGEAVRLVTAYDIRWGCDVLRPVYDATAGLDGRVSLEVDPRLAHDTPRTIAEASALWWLVDRPNLMIKIPATLAGLPAITETIAQGISVNVTLIFSLARYSEVIDAYLAGLEKARDNGIDLSTIRSVASFFVSRVDTEIDSRLDKLGSAEAQALRGKAGIANAQLAYEKFEDAFATSRWQQLATAGAHTQRPLWASTGVKDPAYSDTMYIDELIAADTVNTMPEGTLIATADHGTIRTDSITGAYAAAHKTLDDLAAVGIDYDDVVDLLEREGVQKFEDAWTQLLDGLRTALSAQA